MKIFFVINPTAGTKRNSGDESFIRDFLNSLGIEFKIEHTGGPGSAHRLASQAIAEGFDVVVASGGDGTVNEAAKAVMKSDSAMTIIPRGSGNGLARHHHIPFGIKDNLEMILRNNVIQHDAIAINDQFSVNVSGIGFDAHVASLFGKNGKRGLMGYAKLVIGEFRKYTEKEITITINNENSGRKIFLLAIANSSQFGNNAFIAPDASTHDGIANITLVRKMPILSMPGFALKVFTGSVYSSAFAEKFVAEEMSITSSEEIALHIDGEPSGTHREIKIRTIKNAFKMLVP